MSTELVFQINNVLGTGRQILNRRYDEIQDAISSGTVDETKAVGKTVHGENYNDVIVSDRMAHCIHTGLLDQWLIEGKFTEEEALSQSYDMLSAGIDTVSICIILHAHIIRQVWIFLKLDCV